jgi:hypothetical protein
MAASSALLEVRTDTARRPERISNLRLITPIDAVESEILRVARPPLRSPCQPLPTMGAPSIPPPTPHMAHRADTGGRATHRRRRHRSRPRRHPDRFARQAGQAAGRPSGYLSGTDPPPRRISVPRTTVPSSPRRPDRYERLAYGAFDFLRRRRLFRAASRRSRSSGDRLASREAQCARSPSVI